MERSTAMPHSLILRKSPFKALDMPQLFQRPPSTPGQLKLPKDGPLGIMDLIGEAITTPFGLNPSREGVSPEHQRTLQRAGDAGTLLSMLIPGMGAMRGLGGAAKAPAVLGEASPLMAQSTATILEDVPSLREFMAVGAEKPYVAPKFGDAGELAYQLAKKKQVERNLMAQGR